MNAMKAEESCVENKQSVTASDSSISEESYGFSRMSPAASSFVTSSPSHRTTGPIRRAKCGWTPEEDETLSRAVELHKGRSWKKIAESIPDRTEVQCLHRWQKVINPELVKGPWTPLEDVIINNLVAQYGPTKWSVIAKSLPGRIGKQCRERWHNHLKPEIRKDAWTIEEEIELMKAHIKHGNKWAEISKVITGRTDNSIKNHWNSSLRKKLDYYLRTGRLPPIQKTGMPSAAKDTGNLAARQLIYCSNSGLETNVKYVSETAYTVSSSLYVESSKVAGQHDIANTMTASVSDSYASRDFTVRESDISDAGECNAQVSEIVCVHDASYSGAKLENCNSNGNVSQNEEPSETILYSVPFNISFLCYKPPQLEDLVISGTPLPIGHLTPFINGKCSGEQSIESFLKSAARSFPNTPSIIKKREAYTALPSDTMQSNETRIHDGCTPNEGNVSGNTEGSRFSVLKLLSSPCTSNEDLFNNEKDFNVSPPYRIWSKRKATFKSVEKQLDFTLAERNSDGNTNHSSLAGNRSSFSPNSTNLRVLSLQRRRLEENPAGAKERDFSCTTKMGVV